MNSTPPIHLRFKHLIQRVKLRRFRLKTILVAILIFGLAMGWLASHMRREREQIALIAELNHEGIYAWQYEANYVGWAMQILPVSANEWLVDKIFGWEFCYCPSAISAFPVRSDTVPKLVERMRRLPYLKSITFNPGSISAKDETSIKSALPQIDIKYGDVQAIY